MTCALYDEVLLPARLSLSDVRKLDHQNPVTELSLEPEWGVRSTNSKLVLQKVKGQTVQGQTAQEF